MPLSHSDLKNFWNTQRKLIKDFILYISGVVNEFRVFVQRYHQTVMSLIINPMPNMINLENLTFPR